MGDTQELKKIKKIYGERFKNLCRELFPIIIEQEGTLLSILEKRFGDNCNLLYEAIVDNRLEEDFKEFIFSEYDLIRNDLEEEVKEEPRTPYEILEEQGYELFECKTEEDIQSFKKYYAPNEVLCTIYNGGRLATRDCFFAVRKDVDSIRREDFTKPSKDDEYSISVLGIQFTRDKRSSVQIISRYNHTVSNPNCTLGNDLDNLAKGLSYSFANLLKERGLNFETENVETFEIPGYTLASDGKYYKNYSSWENNNGVIYISENQLEDIEIDYDIYGNTNEYKLWTKYSLVNWIKDYIYDNYEGCYETYDDITEDEYKELINDEKFFEYIGYLCLKNCEWQDLSTYFIENENCEPWVLFVWDEYKKNKKN
jgi:hypothetical protein